MNVLKSTLPRGLLPKVQAPPQSMHFHSSAASLNSQIIDKRTNNVGQTSPEIRSPSNHQQHHAYDSQISCNISDEMMERMDFGRDISWHSPRSTKRTRQSRNQQKIPEKHNTKRQLLNEVMAVDLAAFDGDDDNNSGEDEIDSVDVCNILVVPIESTPKVIPMDLAVSSSANRQRQISITDSEDSFIVFEGCSDGETVDDDDLEIESDSSEEDDEEVMPSNSDSENSVVPSKKVRFAEPKSLCEVHKMIKWSFAYQAARKGPWEMYARDRARFKQRISQVGNQIGHCFEPEHRQKIYDQRFDSSNHQDED